EVTNVLRHLRRQGPVLALNLLAEEWGGRWEKARLDCLLPDGSCPVSTGIDAFNIRERSRDPERWLWEHTKRIMPQDKAYFVLLLEHLFAVRRRAIDPTEVPPPCPAGGVVCPVPSPRVRSSFSGRLVWPPRPAEPVVPNLSVDRPVLEAFRGGGLVR